MRALLQWLRGAPAASAAPPQAQEDDGAVQRLIAEGDHLLRDGGDPAAAEHLYARALELRHDAAAAHCGLAAACAATGRHEDALDAWQLALHFDPASRRAREGMAEALLALDRPAEAVTLLRESVPDGPVDAPARYLLGRALKAAGDVSGALTELRAAAARDPQQPDYQNLAGLLAWQAGETEEARTRLARAAALAPAQAEPRHNLGLVALECGDPAAALDSFRAALATSPRPAVTLSAIGHALRDLGRLDEAVAHYDAALDAEPDLGDARINRTYARLMQEDYARGWDEHECRFEATGTGAGGSGAPRWEGEPLAGRRLLIYGEQGLGDEIMFGSCLPDALACAGPGVTVACEPRLASLFARAFPQVTIVAAARGAGALHAAPPAADFEIPIGSLPRLFRRDARAFPQTNTYLRADPARITRWRAVLAARRCGPWVALAWRGGTLRTRSRQRSLALADCVPLFGPDAAVASVQYGDTAAEIAALRSAHGAQLHVFPEAAAEIEDTAALLAAVDFVVTVDNTVAHLAGALGRPGCVLLSAHPEWRYPRAGERWPWYPSLQLVRQRTPGRWHGAVVRACQLAAATAAPRASPPDGRAG